MWAHFALCILLTTVVGVSVNALEQQRNGMKEEEKYLGLYSTRKATVSFNHLLIKTHYYDLNMNK